MGAKQVAFGFPNVGELTGSAYHDMEVFSCAEAARTLGELHEGGGQRKILVVDVGQLVLAGDGDASLLVVQLFGGGARLECLQLWGRLAEGLRRVATCSGTRQVYAHACFGWILHPENIPNK